MVMGYFPPCIANSVYSQQQLLDVCSPSTLIPPLLTLFLLTPPPFPDCSAHLYTHATDRHDPEAALGRCLVGDHRPQGEHSTPHRLPVQLHEVPGRDTEGFSARTGGGSVADTQPSRPDLHPHSHREREHGHPQEAQERRS